MAFQCPTCGYTRNDVPPARSLGPKGTRMVLKVESEMDLTRKMIISDRATCEIGDVTFPASNKFGLMNSVGGFIERAIADLTMNQLQRKVNYVIYI